MLIAIHHKAEGERIRIALLTIYWTRIVYDGISKLRGVGIVLMLPIPTFFKYTDMCTLALMRGMRLPRARFYLGFIRGEKRKPTFGANTWLQPVLRQKLIATLEQIQDGEYPVRTTTKGEADVREN